MLLPGGFSGLFRASMGIPVAWIVYSDRPRRVEYGNPAGMHCEKGRGARQRLAACFIIQPLKTTLYGKRGMASQRDSTFRPEIEGLRAVAAAMVAIFHIWIGRVSGGVDVFFVVSSFLITTGLLSQIERTGTVDFARFWGRLIRRLLPAALLVLCFVIVVSVLWHSKSRWRDTIEHVAASAVYLENWRLASDAVDYLAQNTPATPVQHYWALSVQGQFYLLWPFLFIAVAWLAKAANVAFRKALVPALVMVFVASLAYSIYVTHVHQRHAYFDTFARIWEFCIGALLAVFIQRISLPNGLRLFAGWAGILAIVGCGFIFQVSRIFPGYAALWPTVAGALVILAGTTRGFGADRFLASKPMVYLGGISYGIYLWHFPILTFCKAYAEPEEIGLLSGLGIMAASVALAALTSRFVEAPLRARKGREEKRWHAYAIGAACLAPVAVGLALWTQHYKHLRAQARAQAQITQVTHPGASVMEPGVADPSHYAKEIYPGPLSVYDDRERLADSRCKQRISEPQECVLGSPQGEFVMAVVGGSHSSQWLPALESIARRENWKIVFFARDNCPFHLGTRVSDGEIDSCREWNGNVFEALVELRPDVVFMTATREQDGDEYVPEGYVAAWRALDKENIRVVALRDNPKVKFDAPECVEYHGADAERCSLRRASVLETPSPLQTLKNPPSNVRFIDLSNYFCDAKTCPPVIGNVMVYRHLAHITATYVRSLEPMLGRELRHALQLPVATEAQVGPKPANAS